MGEALAGLATTVAADLVFAGSGPTGVAAWAATAALKYGCEKYVETLATYDARLLGGWLGGVGANAAASFSSAWNSVLDGLSSEGSAFLRSFMP